MSEEREVKVKTTVSKEGDTGALEETATALDAADAAAKKAAESFVALGEAMLSGDATRIKDSVAAARAEIEQWGPLVKEKFGEASAEAKQLADWLEKIKVVEAGLADPLIGSVQDADAALKRLQETAQGSFRGAGQSAAQAKAQIDEVKRAIEEAGAAGRDVSEATAAVQRLEQGYSSATEKIGRFNAAQSDAKRDIATTTAEAGGQVRGFHSIEGALDQLGGKYTATAIKGLAVVEAFKQGWEWGTKLREGLNQLTDGGFDELLQKLPQVELAVAMFGPKMQTAADGAALLHNQLNILRKNGIDPTGLSADQVQKKVDALGQKVQASGTKASQASADYKAFTHDLALSNAEIQKAGDALAVNVTKFKDANKQLTDTQLGKIFHAQIQSILDDCARLGTEPPAAIQRLAAQFGILTSAGETAAAKTHAVIEKMHTDLVGVAGKTKEEFKKMGQEIEAALEGVDFHHLKLVDPAQFEKAKAEIKGWVDEYRKAGETVPVFLARAADAVDVTVNALERADSAMTSFPAHAKSVSAGIQLIGTGAAQAVPPVRSAGEAIASTGAAAKQGSMSLEELMSKWGPLSERAKAAKQGVDDFSKVVGGSSSTSMAGSASQAKGEVEGAAKAADSLATATEKASTGAAATAAGLDKAKESATGIAAPVNEISTALEHIAGIQFAGSIVAQLKQIQSEADLTVSKLQRVLSIQASGGD